eukprot:661598-Hanusia_phi.AAC.1
MHRGQLCSARPAQRSQSRASWMTRTTTRSALYWWEDRSVSHSKIALDVDCIVIDDIDGFGLFAFCTIQRSDTSEAQNGRLPQCSAMALQSRGSALAASSAALAQFSSSPLTDTRRLRLSLSDGHSTANHWTRDIPASEDSSQARALA